MQSFRRNRYLDPGTGRFTQPDPIGLGGGLDSYGFASGDPVNFSDPFGLSSDTLVVNEVGGRLRPDLEAELDAVADSVPGGRKLLAAARASSNNIVLQYDPFQKGGNTYSGGTGQQKGLESGLSGRSVLAWARFNYRADQGFAGVPRAWVAFHELILIRGFERRGRIYLHEEQAFGPLNALFRARNYPDPDRSHR